MEHDALLSKENIKKLEKGLATIISPFKDEHSAISVRIVFHPHARKVFNRFKKNYRNNKGTRIRKEDVEDIIDHRTGGSIWGSISHAFHNVGRTISHGINRGIHDIRHIGNQGVHDIQHIGNQGIHDVTSGANKVGNYIVNHQGQLEHIGRVVGRNLVTGTTGAIGSTIGTALGTPLGPAGEMVGGIAGRQLGRKAGQEINKKIGLGIIPDHLIPQHLGGSIFNKLKNMWHHNPIVGGIKRIAGAELRKLSKAGLQKAIQAGLIMMFPNGNAQFTSKAAEILANAGNAGVDRVLSSQGMGLHFHQPEIHAIGSFSDGTPFQPIRKRKGRIQSKWVGEPLAISKGGKLVKGSPEAKEKMARLRAMRHKKRGGSMYPLGQEGSGFLPL